jgi:hypothetical protein
MDNIRPPRKRNLGELLLQHCIIEARMPYALHLLGKCWVWTPGLPLVKEGLESRTGEQQNPLAYKSHQSSGLNGTEQKGNRYSSLFS